MKLRKDLKEVKRFDLKVLSPIHIGTKEGSLRALEFLCHGNRVFIIDEDCLGQLLIEKKALRSFMEEVKQGPVNLVGFLKKLDLNLDQIIPRICKQKEGIPGGQVGIQEFRPFIRDGQENIYLPGTSIKGTFRTAILFRLLNDPKWRQEAENLIRTRTPCASAAKKDKAYFSSSLLQERALQDYRLPHRQSGKADPTTDILRCLTVRDAYSLAGPKNQVVPISFLSKRKDGQFYFSRNKRTGDILEVWIEAVVGGTFRLEISWDPELFKKFRESNTGKSFPVNGLADLFTAVEAMNKELIDYEQKEFFAKAIATQPTSLREALSSSGTQADKPAQAALKLQEWYSKCQGDLLRLGFGSGMLSTTVNLRLDMKLRQKVRDHCGSGARPGEVAPKSRRVWEGPESNWFPLGWASLKECPD